MTIRVGSCYFVDRLYCDSINTIPETTRKHTKFLISPTTGI